MWFYGLGGGGKVIIKKNFKGAGLGKTAQEEGWGQEVETNT